MVFVTATVLVLLNDGQAPLTICAPARGGNSVPGCASDRRFMLSSAGQCHRRKIPVIVTK